MPNDMQGALDKIRQFNTKRPVRWRLDVTVWRLVFEGLLVFGMAFLVGLGLGIVYNIFTTFFSL